MCKTSVTVPPSLLPFLSARPTLGLLVQGPTCQTSGHLLSSHPIWSFPWWPLFGLSSDFPNATFLISVFLSFSLVVCLCPFSLSFLCSLHVPLGFFQFLLNIPLLSARPATSCSSHHLGRQGVFFSLHLVLLMLSPWPSWLLPVSSPLSARTRPATSCSRPHLPD